MRLTDLHPEFVDAGGEGISKLDGSPVPKRDGVGVEFDCPCGCAFRLYIPFVNPIDGQRQYDYKGWQRTGETFETLTLTPSIQRVAHPGGAQCNWHGWITHGDIVNA